MELSSKVNREPPAELPGRQMPHLERDLHNPQLVIWAGSIRSPLRICLIMGWICARKEDWERRNEAVHTTRPSRGVASPSVAAVSGGACGQVERASQGKAGRRSETRRQVCGALAVVSWDAAVFGPFVRCVADHVLLLVKYWHLRVTAFLSFFSMFQNRGGIHVKICRLSHFSAC